MSTAARRLAIAAAVALVLAAVNLQIRAKEAIRRGGVVVLLELRPLDPRSLMQGDYMALRFALAEELARRASDDLRAGRATGDGGFAFAAIRVDGAGVATLAPEGTSEPLRLRYRLRGGRPWLGTNAFFFQEGDAARFAPARYGEFRLDARTGEAVLVGLRDGALAPL
jgi:uncharacterized membrane-anchored protein